MTVPRPYEANLGPKIAIFDFQNLHFFFGRKFVSAGSRPDSRRSRELNRRPGRPGEGQIRPNKGHLDPKIGQNLQTKKFPRLVCSTTLCTCMCLSVCDASFT